MELSCCATSVRELHFSVYVPWFPGGFGFSVDSPMNDVTPSVDRYTASRSFQVLRPFLLRRLKVDVEKQMPQKFEHSSCATCPGGSASSTTTSWAKPSQCLLLIPTVVLLSIRPPSALQTDSRLPLHCKTKSVPPVCSVPLNLLTLTALPTSGLVP